MFRTLLALLAFAATLTAQDSRGTVLGRVSDSSGAAVPRATVQLINTATSTTLSATSNESGNYNIPFVIPGTYRLAVEAAGFNKHERPEVPVRINDVLNLDIELRVGNVTETVEVRAEVPLLEAANASTGQVIDQRRVQELPVQAGNAFELLLLTPGTVNSTNTRLRKASATNATSQVITAGAPQYYNEFTIDGIPNTFANGNQMRVAFAPPQSAVSEFKVSTTGYETYLGRTMGSIINVNTVSGTNQFHGEAHHWFANSALDAPNFFQNRSGKKKQVYQDNRFGASLGGPVWFPGYNGKGKTFFFYTHEQNKWGVPRTAIGSIPTEAQRGGDLSGLLARGAQYQIFDPLTTTQVSPGRFGRQPIAGNRIPASRINPISRNIARFWPEPNQPGTVEGRNNFSSGVKDIDSYYVHLARIDHTFSERHRVFFRMHYDWWSEDKQQFYGNETTGVYLNRINRGLAFDDVFVLNPSSVLNFRYGLTSQDFPEERRSAGFDLASLGFSPAYLRQLNPRATAFPFIGLGAVPSGSSLTGFTTNGSANMNGTYSGFSPWEAGDGTNTGIIHTFTGSVSTLKASHSLRYGVDYRLYRAFGNRFPFDIAPALTFSPEFTRQFSDGVNAPIGQELAAFLLGIPDGEQRQSASYATQDKFFGLFFNDDWKVSRKLTINFGVRYEYETPITERFNRATAGFDTGAVNPIQAQAQAAYARNPLPELAASAFRVPGGLRYVARGSAGRQLWQGERNNFLPRLGFAYQITPLTVIRGGAGLFFDTIGTNRSLPYQDGFTQVTPVLTSLDNGLTYNATFANPLPGGIIPATNTPDELTTSLGRGISSYPASRLVPYTSRWSFNLQRQLPAGFLLDLGYMGNRGTRLQIDRNINAVPGSILSTSPERDQPRITALGQQFQNPFFGLDRVYTRTISRANLMRPFPQFGNIMVNEPIGYSWWHAFTVRSERRMSKGFTFQLGYTLSKAMEATQFLNDFETRPYEVVGLFDRPQRITMSGLWEVPFGRGRAVGSTMPRFLDALAGGWQLNGVWQAQSGAALDFGNYILRGDLKSIPIDGSQRSVDRWFNPDVFERAAARQLANNVRTLPLRFSGVRGPGQWKVDMSAIKYIPFGERFKLQVRAEAYNAFNHANFANPATNNVTATGFGQITAVDPARQFQIALKLTF
jgi:hypothetical protein